MFFKLKVSAMSCLEISCLIYWFIQNVIIALFTLILPVLNFSTKLDYPLLLKCV